MHVSVYVCVNSKDILLSVATVHREVHSWGGGSTLLAQFCSPVLSEVSLELAMTLGYSLDIFVPEADETALPCQENV